jgi:biotin transport system substrate-specific component
MNRTKTAVYASMFSAFIAVGAQIQIPIYLIPFTLQTVILQICGILAPAPIGILATLLYLAMGFVGFPVFTGLSGGVGHFSGPTGGFLGGFALGAIFLQLGQRVFLKSKAMLGLALLIHIAIVFFCGAIRLTNIHDTSLLNVFYTYLWPLLPGAAIKLVFTFFLIQWLRPTFERRLWKDR